ncbi:MAG: hypothetical protein H3C39_01185 [Flavobacteriia bacterium]|nr:hypothetical protein [Flavobacteriia bacterium]
MKRICLLIFLVISIQMSAQQDFNSSDLRQVSQLVEMKFVNRLKVLTYDQILRFFNSVESDREFIAQLNINSRGVCDYYKIDNYDIYNYYYKTISRATYNKYCRELNALMLLDGVISQLK